MFFFVAESNFENIEVISRNKINQNKTFFIYLLSWITDRQVLGFLQFFYEMIFINMSVRTQYVIKFDFDYTGVRVLSYFCQQIYQLISYCTYNTNPMVQERWLWPGFWCTSVSGRAWGWRGRWSTLPPSSPTFYSSSSPAGRFRL